MKRPTPIRTRYTDEPMDHDDEDAANALLSPYYEIVGRIASAWSHVEQLIDDTIWTLAEVSHDKGACITSQLQSLYPRFRALSALVELHGGDKKILREIEAVSNSGMSLSKERNRAVHDPIGYHIDKQIAVIHRITADKSLEMDAIPANIAEYKNTRERITQYEKRVMKLRATIYAALPPFADKSP
jgi:hypothetical protein